MKYRNYFVQPAPGKGMIVNVKAFLIVTALLFHGTTCKIKYVDYCKNPTGDISFFGTSTDMDKHVMNISVCTTERSLVMFKLPEIDKGLCLGRLTITKYMAEVDIFNHKKNTCYFMTSEKFFPDSTFARHYNCSNTNFVKNENVFPVAVQFRNSGSDEKCNFRIKYTYISGPAVTKQSCTTDTPCSAPPKEDGKQTGSINPYLVVVVVLAILNALMGAKNIALLIRQRRRAGAQKERDQLSPQN